MSKYMFEKIRNLVREGCSDSEIGRRLRLNRKTVAKYRKSNTPPKYTARTKPTKEDSFEKFESEVESLLAKTSDPNGTSSLTGAEIFELLKEKGYTGSQRTVQRRLAERKKDLSKERFFEQKFEPAEQAQFDFKEKVPLPFTHGEVICHLHFSTLPHSDHFYIKAFPNRCYESFMEGVHAFFEEIGGMTENIRIDNLSPCVKKVLTGNKRLYTAAFDKAIEYYGFKVLPCAPGKGSDKGDVEREIRSRISRILNKIKITKRTFSDFDDLNRWLSEFCKENIQSEKIQAFLSEKASLNPLPSRDQNVLCHVDDIRVSPYGTVRIKRLKASYSVPDKAIGAMCRVVVCPFYVRIYRDYRSKQPIAEHRRLPDGQSSILLSHTISSLVRKPGAMIRWAHRDILFPNSTFKSFYKHLQGECPESAESEFLRSVNLIQHVGIDELSVSMELTIESGTGRPFETLRDLLLKHEHLPNKSQPQQKPITPDLSGYDLLIPGRKEVS